MSVQLMSVSLSVTSDDDFVLVVDMFTENDPLLFGRCGYYLFTGSCKVDFRPGPVQRVDERGGL